MSNKLTATQRAGLKMMEPYRKTANDPSCPKCNAENALWRWFFEGEGWVLICRICGFQRKDA